ncbi:lipid IV(A) 3-deoxy-D-manno-octulosonic acid transferase [Salinisphaera sp. T31B1]|uniref:lipid IV(A) 3-deoxy-D-manno-octulosonic acid transferase n=1 Tax=Salinisphaera sp. T31B1 TaxID=727963 RepID=UPI0033414FBD
MVWRAIYCLATWLVLPFVFAYFYWRSRREPGYAGDWGERLGYIAEQPGAPIWVHAASVGEVLLIAPFVRALREQHPRVPILITTMTPTGRAQARERFGDDGVRYAYLPLDTMGATRRFLRRAAPRVGLLAETELWPNLVAASERARVPLGLLNASLSRRSAARYQRLGVAAIMRFMLSRIAVIAAAHEVHAERFLSLGANPDSVHVTGNLKYDVSDMESITRRGQALREQWGALERPVWVAASTHAGEERLLIETFDRLLQTHGDALLVIAPRHPQRFEAVAQILSGSGYRVARRSRGEAVNEATDIVFADTLGEVPMFYAAADMVFVGGSLLPGVGGHNVIEAAALGRPLCVGAHIEEWREVIEALAEAGAAVVCDTPSALAACLRAWIDDSGSRERAGQAAAEIASTHRGGLLRSLALVRPLIVG